MPNNRIHGRTREKQQIEIHDSASIRERLTPRETSQLLSDRAENRDGDGK